VTFIQPVVTGLLLGGLYAIIGVGMSLIFGIMKLTNLAHGDIMIMSAFLTTIIASQLTGNPILALIITIIIMIPFSILIQKFLINKVIDRGAEAPLLIMFGLSVVIQNAMFLIFGSQSHSIPSQLRFTNVISTQFLSVSAAHLVNFIVAAVVIVGLTLLMNKTAFGRAIRASASNTKAAELMGVNTKRMYIYAMCLTVVVTSIAGLLVGSTFVFFHYTGPSYLIIAFGVVVIGGMGSLMGTFIGGMILGLAQLLGATVFGFPFQDLTGYVVLLILLAIRPQGLLSKALRER